MFQNLSKAKQMLHQKDIKQIEILKGASQTKQNFLQIPKITNISVECVIIDILSLASYKLSFQEYFSTIRKSLTSTKGINNHFFLQYFAAFTSTSSEYDTLLFSSTNDQELNLQKIRINYQLPSTDQVLNRDQIISKLSFMPLTFQTQQKDFIINHIQQSSIILESKNQDINSQRVELFIFTQSKIEKFNLTTFKGTPKSKQQFLFRISISKQVAQSISLMHEKGFTFFPNTLQDIIFFTKSSYVKLLTHKFTNIKNFTVVELQAIKQKQISKMKKSSLHNRSLKFISPQFLHKNVHLVDVRRNDIWKFGLFMFSLLTGQQFSSELFNLECLQQNKLYDYKVLSSQKLLKIAKYLKDSYKSQLQCSLIIDPIKRASSKQLKNALTKIEESYSESQNFSQIQRCKFFYHKQQVETKARFNIQINQNEQLLTFQLKKKVSEYFKSSQNRVLKNCTFIFRASQSKFSSRSFYEAVFQRKNILIVLLQKKDKKKILCYSQQVFDLTKCIGVFGGYIKDQKKFSFIYSPLQNEFLKLKNPDKAIGVSLLHGPIIGEGDLVISDRAVHNTCRFPRSFESSSGKVKRLLKSDKFQVEQYFVYHLTF